MLLEEIAALFGDEVGIYRKEIDIADELKV
jgi:hypothetical protein